MGLDPNPDAFGPKKAVHCVARSVRDARPSFGTYPLLGLFFNHGFSCINNVGCCFFLGSTFISSSGITSSGVFPSGMGSSGRV